VPIIAFGLYHNFDGIVAHMLPYGAPTALILFLPLVEIFSQLIRPLTLTIRFATNISAGHIMIFIFSYFSMLSSALAPILYIVLSVLLIIEVFIAFLQRYIFVTLLSLYFRETI
jgi:F-type H+-transporting ATPase subunit a